MQYGVIKIKMKNQTGDASRVGKLGSTCKNQIKEIKKLPNKWKTRLGTTFDCKERIERKGRPPGANTWPLSNQSLAGN